MRSRSRAPIITLLVVVVAALLILFRAPLRSQIAHLLLFTKSSRPASATYQAVLYEQVSKENAELSALLKLPHATVFASGRVVSKPPKTAYDTLLTLIDPALGVHEGDEALYAGMYLGLVQSAHTDTATILLASSPGFSTDAAVGTPRAIVVVTGLGGGAFEFEISSKVTVTPGDIIETTSGHPLAIVRSVTPEEGSSSSKVTASNPVALSDLDIIEFMHQH